MLHRTLTIDQCTLRTVSTSVPVFLATSSALSAPPLSSIAATMGPHPGRHRLRRGRRSLRCRRILHRAAPEVRAFAHGFDVRAGLRGDLIGAEPAAALFQDDHDLCAAGRKLLLRSARSTRRERRRHRSVPPSSDTFPHCHTLLSGPRMRRSLPVILHADHRPAFFLASS